MSVTCAIKKYKVWTWLLIFPEVIFYGKNDYIMLVNWKFLQMNNKHILKNYVFGYMILALPGYKKYNFQTKYRHFTKYYSRIIWILSSVSDFSFYNEIQA